MSFGGIFVTEETLETSGNLKNSITHHIIDRPLINNNNKKQSQREYVQP